MLYHSGEWWLQLHQRQAGRPAFLEDQQLDEEALDRSRHPGDPGLLPDGPPKFLPDVALPAPVGGELPRGLIHGPLGLRDDDRTEELDQQLEAGAEGCEGHYSVFRRPSPTAAAPPATSASEASGLRVEEQAAV